MLKTRDTRIFNYAVLAISALVVVLVIPEFKSIPTGCMFNKITGFYCAGCGITRSIHSLLRGDILQALCRNLLLVTAFPLSAIWMLLRYFKLKQSSDIKKYDKIVIISFIIYVALFTVLRNIPSPYFNFLRHQ